MPLTPAQLATLDWTTYCDGGPCIEEALLPDGRFAVRSTLDPAHAIVVTAEERGVYLSRATR